MLYQQLDGSEVFIIHKVDGQLFVGGANDVYDSFDEYRIIEDRYPLIEETLETFFSEVRDYVKENQ